MRIYAKIEEIVSENYFHEIVSTVNSFKELIRHKESLSDNHAIAILGSECYYPPLVTCCTIIIPKSLSDAKFMFEKWISIEHELMNLSQNKLKL